MISPNDKFEDIREYYNNDYYENISSDLALPWHCKKIGERLQEMNEKSVLDVACGTGEWLGYFKKRGAQIAGIDLSQRAIEECQKRFPDGEFVCGPAEVLPFEDARFDLITCMGSLEHFLDKPKALAEMRRVAKPDAEFVILVPNAGFLTRRLGLYKGTQQVKAKEDVFDLATWEKLLADSGLQVKQRWRDLHPLSCSWIMRGNALFWPIRALQAVALATWPIAWQYQVYHYCKATEE